MTQAPLRVLVLAALGATLLDAQALTVLPMPKGTNTLLGRVVEIGNDAPVSGAIVTVIGHFDASGKPAAPDLTSREMPPSLNLMTTADGYFVARNLPAGRFTVVTRAHGYMNNEFPPNVVEVRDSQKPTEYHVRVWKHAAIGGRVVDERGEPVSGVLVFALRRMGTGNHVFMRRIGTVTGITDDRGVYRISQLPPGEYTAGILSTTTTLPVGVAAALDPSAANRDSYNEINAELRVSGFFRTWGCPECVSSSHEGHHIGGLVLQRPGSYLPPAPDGRPLGFTNTFYPGTSNAREAQLVSLASGESRTDLDLVLRLTPTVSVSGVLTGPDGPMGHTMIRLASPDADHDAFDPGGIATAITDGKGAFTFLGITPGEYTLHSELILDFNERTGEGRRLWALRSLSVGDKGISGLNITLQPGVRVNGSVEFRNASGVTSGPSTRVPIVFIPVGAVATRSMQAVLHPTGTFRSMGEIPGRYLVSTSAPAGWYWQSTTLNGKPLPGEVIEVGSTEVSGLLLTFKQATNRISGIVTGSTGAPDSDAAVILFSVDSDVCRSGQFLSRHCRSMLATSAGTFEAATLAPGDYYLAAVSKRVTTYPQNPDFLARLVAAGAIRFTLGPEEEKTVPLRTLTLPGR
jgi:hypothetical protein